MIVRMSCSWCNARVTVHPGEVTRCLHCGHHANLPRLDCGCAVCWLRRVMAEEIRHQDDDGRKAVR